MYLRQLKRGGLTLEELNYIEASEQLRMASQSRYDAFIALRNAQDELEDAERHQAIVSDAYTEAKQVAEIFLEKWKARREEVKLEIADIKRVLEPILADLKRSQSMMLASYKMRHRRDAEKHKNDATWFQREARPFRDEESEYQAVLKTINLSIGEVEQSLAGIRAAERSAHAQVQTARQALKYAQKCVQAEEVHYANADEELARAKPTPQARREMRRRSIIARAGVPEHFRDDVEIRQGKGGKINLYFGGIDGPLGENHGHYVLDDSTGLRVYARDPFEPHGAHNYLPSLQLRKGTNPTQP